VASNQSAPKLFFVFDHLDLAQRLLVALETEPLLLRVPPYASRLVLQLWRLKSGPVGNSTVKSAFVKILYKGVDITKNLPFCNLEMKKGSLCSLATFSKQIEKIVQPYDNYSQACSY
jgi:hypothetical protein